MSIVNLSTKIKQARAEAGYSQKQIAEILGVTDKTISAYESGRAAPPVEKLQKISKATNRPMSFFSGDESKDYSIESRLAAIEREFIEIKKLLLEQKK